MRTYARSGLKVAAVAVETHADWAPALRSRACSRTAVLPDYTAAPDGYLDGLLELIAATSPAMVLPAHDGSIQALRARRSELEQHVALPLASEAALDIAISKARTLALATELGIAIPRGVHVSSMDDLEVALDQVGLPAVVKPVQSWVEHNGAGMRLSSSPVQSVEEARRTLEWVFAAGGEALIQQWLPGRREAVSVLFARDRFWARIAQVSHREWPVLGGVSVLCETIPLLPDITSQSERLIRAIDLEGPSMVEFRRDAEGRPVLMEVNPRMGGSVALAMSAGVNLPMLTYNWAVGNRLQEVSSYHVGSKLRWLAGDIWNLKCAFDSQGEPDVPTRRRATAEFLRDFARPSVKLDVVELGDMRPAISEMNKIVFRHGLRRVQNLAPIQWLSRVGKVN